MINGTIIADLCGFANDHAHSMVDKKILANLSAGVDLDAGKMTAHLRDQPG